MHWKCSPLSRAKKLTFTGHTSRRKPIIFSRISSSGAFVVVNESQAASRSFLNNKRPFATSPDRPHRPHQHANAFSTLDTLTLNPTVRLAPSSLTRSSQCLRKAGASAFMRSGPRRLFNLEQLLLSTMRPLWMTNPKRAATNFDWLRLQRSPAGDRISEAVPKHPFQHQQSSPLVMILKTHGVKPALIEDGAALARKCLGICPTI